MLFEYFMYHLMQYEHNFRWKIHCFLEFLNPPEGWQKPLYVKVRCVCSHLKGEVLKGEGEVLGFQTLPIPLPSPSRW